MATVETVLGPIDASKLGATLSHEHVIAVMGADNVHYPWLFDWERTRANSIRELSEAKAGGVDTVIDLTTPDLGRDVELAREISRASGGQRGGRNRHLARRAPFLLDTRPRPHRRHLRP